MSMQSKAVVSHHNLASMSNEVYINFNYQSPYEDLVNVMGFNPDGSANIRYTLFAMKKLLQHNINLLDKLVEKIDCISDIIPIGPGMIEVKFDPGAQIQKEHLVENQILTCLVDEESSAEDPYEDRIETNNDRLAKIDNLTNLSEFPGITEVSESDSDADDIVGDTNNQKILLDKYQSLLGDSFNRLSDSDSS